MPLDLFQTLEKVKEGVGVTDVGDLGSEFMVTDSCAETGCGDWPIGP